MTSGPVNANNIGIYIAGVMIGCLDSASFTSENSEIEVKCKDYTGTLPGTNKWSLEGSGVVRYDAAYGPVDLLTAHQNGDTLTVKFGTSVTGDMIITGSVTLPTFSLASGVDEAAKYNFKMAGQGAYVIGTNP
jgi:hypothetical protein